MYSLYDRGTVPQAMQQAFREKSAYQLFMLQQGGIKDANVYSHLAQDARRMGELGIATDFAKTAIQLQPKPHRSTIQATRILAQAAMANRDFPAAAKHYRELLKMQRTTTDMHYLGLSEQNTRHSAEAVQILQECVQMDPTLFSSYDAMQAILASNGREQDAAAIAELSKAIEAAETRAANPKQ